MEYSDKININSTDNKKRNFVTYHEKILKQLKIVLKLAKINGYDEIGRIRNKTGTFIENSNIIQLLGHAMTVSRVLLAEKEFIDLLNEANIDADLIVNDNIRAKLLKLREQGNVFKDNQNEINTKEKSTILEPRITEARETQQKRKLDESETDDDPPILEKYDGPPPKRSKQEADKLEMPVLERQDEQIVNKKRKQNSTWEIPDE